MSTRALLLAAALLPHPGAASVTFRWQDCGDAEGVAATLGSALVTAAAAAPGERLKIAVSGGSLLKMLARAIEGEGEEAVALARWEILCGAGCAAPPAPECN